jgi:hypothetical protein
VNTRQKFNRKTLLLLLRNPKEYSTEILTFSIKEL